MKIPKEIKEKRGLNNTNGILCSVIECNKKSVRNISEYDYNGLMILAKLKYIRKRSKRIYLCKEHFSIVNKEKNKNKIKKKGFLENQLNPYKNSW